MSTNTAIEWTQATWNPTTGCDRISPGCDHCYALTLAGRLKAMGQPKYQTDGEPDTSGPGFGLAVHPSTLDMPLRWRTPRLVFVNSMSDLFHHQVPVTFIARVFAVMALARRHTFQLLTKRHGRTRNLLTRPDFHELVADHATDLIASRPWQRWQLDLGGQRLAGDSGHGHGWTTEDTRDGVRWAPPWPLPNVWLGTSVEDQRWADIRVPSLLETPAAVRWLSCEPLLGPVDITDYLPYDDGHDGLSQGVNWVVAGGESGRDARPMHQDWVRSLRDQCEQAEVPFFFKQWGGRTPKAGGRELDGRTWDEWP